MLARTGSPRRERRRAGRTAEMRALGRGARAGSTDERPRRDRAALLGLRVLPSRRTGARPAARRGAAQAAGTCSSIVLHEFAYPWRLGGLRGQVWALTAARRRCSALLGRAPRCIVTTDCRARWLALAALAAAPPAVPWRPCSRTCHRQARRHAGCAGARGRRCSATPTRAPRVSLVLDALSGLRRRRAAGATAAAGRARAGIPRREAWRRGSGRARHGGRVRVHADGSRRRSYPTRSPAATCCSSPMPTVPRSRKGTLAGSLASGRPVVAHRRPPHLEGARQDGDAACRGRRRRRPCRGDRALLVDRRERDALGARGRAFAESQMAWRADRRGRRASCSRGRGLTRLPAPRASTQARWAAA